MKGVEPGAVIDKPAPRAPVSRHRDANLAVPTEAGPAGLEHDHVALEQQPLIDRAGQWPPGEPPTGGAADVPVALPEAATGLEDSAADEWLEKNPWFVVHYTPTHASWMNLVEVWFGIVERQANIATPWARRASGSAA